MTFSTHTEELEFLDKMGFPINPYNKVANSLNEIWEASENLNKNKQNLSYPIDGLVVKLNDNELVERLGIVGKTRRGWCAIKFAAEEVTTKIQGVSWQVGRSGKVTPVADLEPVLLAGTIVKRATLHNYKEFVEKDLQLADTLIIRKAGEIIPEVVSILYNLRIENKDKLQAPDSCPSCQTKLALSNTKVDLLCTNTAQCQTQILNRLAYYCQRNIASITGLSEKQLEKFMNLFKVNDIPDLYNLPLDEIEKLDGFGEKSVNNLAESIEKARKLDDYKFLAGLGLDGIGPEVAKLICQAIQED